MSDAIHASVVSVIGDALAFALMRARRVTPDHLARSFPHSRLEANMQLTVADVMHGAAKIARVDRQDTVREVVVAMTRHPLGAACVLGHNGCLEGLITEAELALVLETKPSLQMLRAADIMDASPLTVTADICLRDALRLLEDHPSARSILLVVAAERRCLGLVRLLDICHAGLA